MNSCLLEEELTEEVEKELTEKEEAKGAIHDVENEEIV